MVMNGETDPSGRRRKRDLDDFVRLIDSHEQTDTSQRYMHDIAYSLPLASYVAATSNVPQANEAPVT